MAKQPNADVKAADDKRSEAELRKASEDLKGRIEEAKRANNMPLDAALGSPDFEKRAADGHLDRAEDEDE